MAMTPDELFAQGYCLQHGTWGVTVFYRIPEVDNIPGVDSEEEVFQVHFGQPTPSEEAIRRGWEAAEVDFVKRRLTS